MKLSLNLPDENKLQNQNLLLKAKLPMSIFNQPFTSAFTTATNSFSDLSFSLSTSFSSGPSLRLTYAPSTTTTTDGFPFSLSIKSGLGFFGSPHNSPLVFSACFSLFPTSTNAIFPTFSLHFKPQLGHFCLHKRTFPSRPTPNSDTNSGSRPTSGPHLDSGSPSSSDFVNGFAPDGSVGWQEVKLEPCSSTNNKANGVYADNSGILAGKELLLKDGQQDGVLTGFGIKARTVFPLTKRVVVNLRWGVNMPSDFGAKMPYLTVNKIGIERVVEEVKEVKTKRSDERNEGDLELLKGMCFWMRRDLEVLEKENREMKESLEDLRSGVSSKNLGKESKYVGRKVVQASSDGFGEFEQRRSIQKVGEGNGRREPKKPVNQVMDLESELQRAIKAASS